MTRINTNVSSLVAQNRLQSSNADLQTALTRLSTGLRINSGADDPAGLIASEALRSEVTSLGKAISNTRRASQIISTADSSLGQVSNLLNDIRGLVVEAANSGALSDDEIAANQLQIDSSLEAINRIAQTTTFQGRKLLDGSLDFVSGANAIASVRDAKLDQANLGATGQIDVEVVIEAAATQAEVSTTGFSAAAAANATGPSVRTVQTTIGGETIDITGDADFQQVDVVDDAGAGGGEASYDESTGVLTISADITGVNTDASVIESAINDIEGLVADGATGAGTGAGPTSSTNTNAAADLLTVTATENGADYNNVTVDFVSGSSNSADYDSEQKVLTVTVDDSAPQTATDIATAIDNATVDGAAPSSAVFSATGLAAALVDINEGVDEIQTETTGGEVLTDALVFQLNGATGAETFNFGAGTSIDQVADAVNLVSDSTGWRPPRTAAP